MANGGFYWSSTINETGYSPRLFFGNGSANMNTEVLSYGFSVRCVQAFTATLLILYFQMLITFHHYKLPTFTPSKEWRISGVPKVKAFGRVIHVNSVIYRLIKEFMAGHYTE